MPEPTANNAVAPVTPKDVDLPREISTGIFSGLVIAEATYIAESVKKLHQSTGKGLVELFRSEQAKLKLPTGQMLLKVIRDKGKIGDFMLFRGSLIFAANIVPTTTTQWVTKAYLNRNFKSDNNTAEILTEGISGVAGAFTATAVENTIVRQQKLQSGPWFAINDMIKHRGVLGPWKSISLIGTRDFLFTSWMFGLNPKVKAYAAAQVDPAYATLAATIASILFGSLGAAISHPFDTAGTASQQTHEVITLKEAFIRASKLPNGVFTGLLKRVILFNAFANFIPKLKEYAEGHYDAAFSTPSAPNPKIAACDPIQAPLQQEAQKPRSEPPPPFGTTLVPRS